MHNSEEAGESLCKIYTLGRAKRSLQDADGDSGSSAQRPMNPPPQRSLLL